MKAKRMTQILNYVSQIGVCSYEELSKHFNVSSSTIRRDVEELLRSNSLSKTRGGVIATEASGSVIPLAAPPMLAVSGLNMDDKKFAIARRASDLVEDNDIIFLGSGVTVACMVPYLKGKRGLYIITNNLHVLNGVKYYSLNAMVVGGNLNLNTMSIVGIQSIRQLQSLNANKAFLGCNGITTGSTVTNVSEVDADIKREAMAISNECYLLTECQKFGKMSLYTFANLEDFEATITDSTPSKEFIDIYQHIDRKLIIANQL